MLPRTRARGTGNGCRRQDAQDVSMLTTRCGSFQTWTTSILRAGIYSDYDRMVTGREASLTGGLLIFSQRTEQPAPQPRASDGTNTLAAYEQWHAARRDSSESVAHRTCKCHGGTSKRCRRREPIGACNESCN